MHTHTYRSSLCWRGSTAAGYESYDRTHRIDVPTPRDTLTLSGSSSVANYQQVAYKASWHQIGDDAPQFAEMPPA